MDAPRSWRDETRRCFYCRREFRPVREAQRFCKPACKRAAAYGRERFKNGTKGPRRRRLEGSEIVPGTQREQSETASFHTQMPPGANREALNDARPTISTLPPAEDL